ncbi:MAG TPA: FAD-binding oxidoreductase [Burkholderiaceae bacterium]|nr:FAD-binding oxidoreductase [Burkholderiaceae bacterium]
MSASSVDRAAVVIVGGGVLGCSIAWHLARKGVTDVLVLERNELGSGATSRSAGLVARGRLHAPTMAMVRRTRDAIAELESALCEDVGFRRVGSVRVARSASGAEDLIKMDRMLTDSGIELRNINETEAVELVPWLDASGASRISYVEDDGYVDAYRLATAYARAARAQGVRFRVRTSVGAILEAEDRVTGVQTDTGPVHAAVVVNAAGAWAINLAKAARISIGTAPVRSHYYITAPQAEWPRDHPVVYLPDARAYARPEVGGLLIGVQEPQSRTYDARMLPADIADFPLSDASDEWTVLSEHAVTLRAYIPQLDALPLAHHITGLSTYTPDGRFLIGQSGALEGFYIAGGCCGTGVSASGGIGAAVANLVMGEPADVDVSDFAPERFGAIDPYSAAFRERCAAARASKLRLG